MKNEIEANGENVIGTWTINCIPFGGGRLLGKLHVTDKSLYYEAQYDVSFEGITEQIATSAVAAAGHALLVSPEICNQWKDKGYLKIPKADIADIIEKSSFFKKKLTLKLKDDQEIIFDYGMLSVKKLRQAIESN